jgi:hypothetical protein
MFSATNPRTFWIDGASSATTPSIRERLDIFIGDSSKLDLHCANLITMLSVRK